MLHQQVSHFVTSLVEKEKKIEYLERLRESVAQLLVIVIEIQNEEEAYEIFETTNARGIKLSVADLLKNLIFKKLPATDIKDYAKDLWSEITENIQATNTELKKFIRYYWISKYAFVSEKRLYREIKKEIADWKELLEDLWFASSWYNKLLDGGPDSFSDFKHGARIFKAVFSLRIMRVTQCYVFLLSLLRNYEKLGTDPVHVFEVVERFSFKYSAICKMPSNRVERLYSRYAILIEKTIHRTPNKKVAGEIQSIFSKLEDELSSISPPRDFFIDNFYKVSYKKSAKSRHLIKYIFSEVDSHYRPTDEVVINFSEVNIEHILPGKPHEGWGLTANEIKPYVNQLGNLTLLSKQLNSKIQNGILSNKLPYLEESQLPVTQKLVEFLKENDVKWGQEQIIERQQHLAELSFDEIWN